MKKMLRNKLAMLLANLKKKRPYYCEVEYLEGTGTQYIDTGYIPSNTTGQYARMKYTTVDNGVTYGSMISNNRVVGPYYAPNTSKWYCGWGATEPNIADSTPTTTATYELYLNFKNDRIAKVNDMILSSSLGSISGNYPSLTLFRRNFSSAYSYLSGKIYKYQITEGSSLVRDYIPVLDWDMKPAMYDKITGQFSYNAGTGEFLYGREIHYVDYIESTGTQYIDTGVYLTNNHSVEIDYQLTSASQNRKGIFGGLVANGARYGALLSPSNNYLEFGYGSTNVWYQTGLPDTNRHVIQQKKNLLYFDGALTHTFNTATFTQNFTSPLGSFAYTNYLPASSKYYASKWWNGDTLIRDYKPAIDENGVGFWFDKVSHTIYDNAGTGAFKYPVREAEYLEVTDLGSENNRPCIDLGLKYKPSMSIECKYTRTEQGDSGSVLPLSTTTTAPLIYIPALNSNTQDDRFVWRRPGYSESSYFYRFSSFPYTLEYKVDAVNDTLSINGNTVKTGMIRAMNGYSSPYQSSSNLYMLSIDGAYGGMGKINYLKIYDTTQVYRDLVPAFKDGIAGMYDKEHDVFRSNFKTGTVICGKIVESLYE